MIDKDKPMRAWIFAAAFALAACGELLPTPAEPAELAPPEADTPAEPGREPIAGGWAPADPEQRNVAPARDLALKTVRERHGGNGPVEVAEAEIQVVAGLNFRFRIEAADNPAAYAVTIYQNLDGALEVTDVRKIQ